MQKPPGNPFSREIRRSTMVISPACNRRRYETTSRELSSVVVRAIHNVEGHKSYQHTGRVTRSRLFPITDQTPFPNLTPFLAPHFFQFFSDVRDREEREERHVPSRWTKGESVAMISVSSRTKEKRPFFRARGICQLSNFSRRSYPRSVAGTTVIGRISLRPERRTI